MTVDAPPLPAAAAARGLPSRRGMEASRIIRAAGYVTIVLALSSAGATFLILMGLTPILPTQDVVRWAVIVNSLLVASLIFVVGWEIASLVLARRRGRAAARLHIRIVALFSVVAITPSILLAVIASVTLDRGLDNWFSTRTRAIVENSAQIAQAFIDEQVQTLHGVLLSMKDEIERARPLLLQDADRFQAFITSLSRARNLPGLFLVNSDRTVVVEGELGSATRFPPPPVSALERAKADPSKPALIPPGSANLIGDILKLQGYDDLYLYVVRPVEPRVLRYIQMTNDSLNEYRALEATRFNIQVAFGLLFFGISLVLLVSAIWLGISLANRLVAPIRRLIDATTQVSEGNLEVRVPTRSADGDLGALGDTFNTMTAQLRSQRAELLSANQVIDSRRRFSEAVLSGVTAGVVGIDREGRVTIVNRTALRLLGGKEVPNDRLITEIMPELEPVVSASRRDKRPEHRDQITVNRGGRQRNLNVRVTSEAAEGEAQGYVITLDDITDLVMAQRSSAWADVARRIAHEIKNPLTPIQLSAERLRRRFSKNIGEGREIFDQCTDTIIRQVGDIGRMVDEFSSFARMPKPAFEVRNLSESIREAVFLIEVAHPDIVFRVELPTEPLLGNFDARLMGQVLTNIVKNATEAIAALPPEQRTGGHITVSGARTPAGIVVEVVDDGIGLPSEGRHRLLEPYMTTREKGTGLGLAIVAKIVEDHGGRIDLLDAPEVAKGGHGALIRITLPALDPPAVPPAAAPETHAAV